MENDHSAQTYQERIQRLFERVSNIHNYSEEEKAAKIREVEAALAALGDQLERRKDARESQIASFGDKIKQLKQLFEDESAAKVRLESKLQADLEGVERHSQRLVEEAKASRDEVDRRLVAKLNGAIDLIQAEIPRCLKDKTFEHQKELDQIVKVELPALQEELGNECQLRKELEMKIYEGFMEQMKELGELYQEEKRVRELKEEELVGVINGISREVEAGLKRQRADREASEENILELVEKVIERLKKDISV